MYTTRSVSKAQGSFISELPSSYAALSKRTAAGLGSPRRSKSLNTGSTENRRPRKKPTVQNDKSTPYNFYANALWTDNYKLESVGARQGSNDTADLARVLFTILGAWTILIVLSRMMSGTLVRAIGAENENKSVVLFYIGMASGAIGVVCWRAWEQRGKLNDDRRVEAGEEFRRF
ncbi:uncharacterized protein V1518DRAFT_421932 [Limtongia smithiae]|uniref:uncharacterized protein n=1 Tax=Limtongia smithiae TaxID=1125753 RepID=UPI0034CD4A49